MTHPLRTLTPRQRSHGPRNAAEAMIWDNRRRAALTPATGVRIPMWGDTIVREPGTAPDDEMDAGFYGALVLPLKVGSEHGEVPMLVAMRLFKAGLVRIVPVGVDAAANDNAK